jgi:hypothetical protein
MASQPLAPGLVLVPGPLESAYAWLTAAVQDADLAAAWPDTDPNLRLVLVQSWICANRSRPPVSGWNREELARGLTPARSTHPLWAPFAARQVEKLRAWWGNPNLDEWGATIKGRVVPSEYELIRFAPAVPKGGHVPKRASPGAGRLLLVRATSEGWVVAGFDRNPPVPGWPPRG